MMEVKVLFGHSLQQFVKGSCLGESCQPHAWEDIHSSLSSVTSPMVLASGKRTFPMSLIPFSKQVLLSLLLVLGLLIYSRCLGWLPVVVLPYWGTGHHMVSLLLVLYPCMAAPRSKLGEWLLKNHTQPHAEKDLVLRLRKKN